jgi:chorismate lyase / 3-hydroxybenzoate synthase
MSDAAAPALLTFRFGPADRLAADVAARPEETLLVVRYGSGVDDSALPAPVLAVPNPRLDAAAGLEIWGSTAPVERGASGAVAWAEDGSVLAGAVRWRLGDDLAGETRDHFGELLDLLIARGYPHLYRVWNYLPGINAEQGGLERYRLFNVGRARAFEERFGEDAAIARFSASSAVGAPGDELVTGFLAGRAPGRHLENPRQVPAFRYPALYGPKSPSFCRGTLAETAEGTVFFLSGTASIVGHRSRWMGDVGAQFDETLANVEALSVEAERACGGAIGRLPEFALVKTYLRDAEDLSLVQTALARAGVPPERSLLLEAEICRAELDLELEGIAILG